MWKVDLSLLADNNFLRWGNTLLEQLHRETQNQNGNPGGGNVNPVVYGWMISRLVAEQQQTQRVRTAVYGL